VTQPPRKKQSRHLDPAFHAEVYALKQQGLSFRAVADRLHSSYSTVYRAYTAYIALHALPTSNGHHSTPATLPQRVEVMGEPDSAETVQTWDDPEDAEPERWNLWLPRGLKRRIEAAAKSAGIASSQLVQRLLMASLGREGER
jgi:hypothetical protein